MESNENNDINLNTSHKFNSGLLNRPFSSKIEKFGTNLENSNSCYSLNNSQISSLTSSINFSQKDLSNSNLTKRKPFDKLSFNATSSSNNIEKPTNNITESINNNETNIANMSITNSNLSFLSEDQKSFIKSQQYKSLSKETLEKAIKYNSQFNSTLPFWIKFFLETEDLKSNSSYFKVDDKDKYINNLIQMVKRDAELYDKNLHYQNVKEEAKNNIKSLLITEIDVKEQTDKDKIDEKIAEILLRYNKIDKKENNLENYEQFKNKVANNNYFNKNKTDKKINKIEENINKIENSIDKINKENTQPNDFNELKLIGSLNFDPLDDFKELDYSSVELGVLKPKSLNRLLEIDRQLNQLNKDLYNQSINTTLKNIQKNFNDKKEIRANKIQEKYKESIKYKPTDKNKKTSVFDIKQDDNEKIIYKDYLKEIKEKKEKNSLLNTIDDKISIVKSKPIDEEKRKKIYEKLDQYHLDNQFNEEYQKKINEEIIGFPHCTMMIDLLRDISKRQDENKILLKQYENDLEIIDTKKQINNDEQWKEDLKQPYENLMQEVECEYKSNLELLERVDKISKSVNEAGEYIEKISKNIS